jgi:predicted acyl esterase
MAEIHAKKPKLAAAASCVGSTLKYYCDSATARPRATNRRRGYATYPVPGSRQEDWHLQPDGGLEPTVAPPRPSDVYDCDPKDPAPTVGGSTLLTPSLPAGPHDQSAVEARPDVLSYTSEVLWAAGITFLPAHRLRVDITSSPHPRWDRNLNTGHNAWSRLSPRSPGSGSSTIPTDPAGSL